MLPKAESTWWLFFSNGPHELQGPDKELCIGLNLGIDWYVLGVQLVVNGFERVRTSEFSCHKRECQAPSTSTPGSMVEALPFFVIFHSSRSELVLHDYDDLHFCL